MPPENDSKQHTLLRTVQYDSALISKFSRLHFSRVQQFFELIDLTFFTGIAPPLNLLYNVVIRLSSKFVEILSWESKISDIWTGLRLAIRSKDFSVSAAFLH